MQSEARRSAGSVGLTETQRVVLFTEDDPLALDSGASLAPVEVAYESYGELAADAANAVFICHALTGDAHAAGHHGDPSRVGWWDNLIGPGKPIDTDRWYVVSANLLGGCRGTTGPSSIDPATGRPYGSRFPFFSVADLVKVHRRLQGAEPSYGFGIDFAVESYLDHQARSFLARFDANSYLALSRVMDYFDPFADEEAAREALARGSTRFLVVSFDTDWRFPTEQSLEIVRMLDAAGAASASANGSK